MQSRLVFIAGSPRTGTTALVRMLAEHPHVLHVDVDDLGTRTAEGATFETGIFARLSDDADVVARFEAVDGRKPFIVEKTPRHVHHIERIRKVLPGSKFILTLRSGADAVLSMKIAQAGFWKGASDHSFAKICRTWERSTRAVLAEVGKPDVLPVRFEHLMADREEVARRIFSFLDLDPAPLADCIREMDNPAKERVPGVVGNSQTGDGRMLTPMEKAMFAYHCGRTQRMLGFPFPFSGARSCS